MKYCESCSKELIIFGNDEFGKPIYHCWNCNTHVDVEVESINYNFSNVNGVYIIEYEEDDDCVWEEENVFFSKYELAEDFLIKQSWEKQTNNDEIDVFKKDNVVAKICFAENFYGYRLGEYIHE